MRSVINFVTLTNDKQFPIPQLVAHIAAEYHQQLGTDPLIRMFELEQSNDGLYYFLGKIINHTEDASVQSKYIIAATELGDLAAVESAVAKCSSYDPIVIRDFFFNSDLNESQQNPLITVCDRFGYIDELIRYFYHRNMLQNIEMYVQLINPKNTPKVVGTLLDVQCSEDFIKRLIMSSKNMCPVDVLIDEVTLRNRLKLLLDFLEYSSNQGSPFHFF